MGDGVERSRPQNKPTKTAAAVAQEFASYDKGINVHALPVDLLPGCLLVSTSELEYYPPVLRPEERRANGRTRVKSGYYWHVPVGRYRKREWDLDLVLVISVFAQISEEEGLQQAELIRQSLGIANPSQERN